MPLKEKLHSRLRGLFNPQGTGASADARQQAAAEAAHKVIDTYSDFHRKMRDIEQFSDAAEQGSGVQLRALQEARQNGVDPARVESTALQKMQECMELRNEWDRMRKGLDSFWQSQPQQTLQAAGQDKEAADLAKDFSALMNRIDQKRATLQQAEKRFADYVPGLADDKPAVTPVPPISLVFAMSVETQSNVTVMRPIKFRSPAA